MATQLVRSHLSGCHALILEANHDIDLLTSGPYPWELKQRIRSRHGHLSNTDSLELIKSLHNDALRIVVFAHLSEVNNRPEIVVQASREIFLPCPEWQDVRFVVGRQHEVTPGTEVM